MSLPFRPGCHMTGFQPEVRFFYLCFICENLWLKNQASTQPGLISSSNAGKAATWEFCPYRIKLS
jgi:hypothetical protein